MELHSKVKHYDVQPGAGVKIRFHSSDFWSFQNSYAITSGILQRAEEIQLNFFLDWSFQILRTALDHFFFLAKNTRNNIYYHKIIYY